MPGNPTVLIVDADPAFRRDVAGFLDARGYAVQVAENGRRANEALRDLRPDHALVDLELSDHPSLEIVRRIAQTSSNVVCVSSARRVADIVAAVKAGARDVLEKPLDFELLHRSLSSNGRAHLDVTERIVIDPLVRNSAIMRATLARIEDLATRASAIHIYGESGVGKAAVARHFHASGDRASGPFVVVPAIPKTGSVGEALFGSSAIESAFARAKGGVIYVESLLSLGPVGQERLAKLLLGLSASRVSGSGVRWPPMIISGDASLSVDVEAGRVRRDLGRALAEFSVEVPPLRERKDDIGELIDRIARAIQMASGNVGATVSPDVVEELRARSWPGNIPELIDVVRRAAVVDANDRIAFDLSATVPPVIEDKIEEAPRLPAIRATSDAWTPTLGTTGQVQPYDVYEAEIFRFALANAGGCVSRAAELLGVGRATMYRKMRAYGIDVPPVSERAVSRTRRGRPDDVDCEVEVVAGARDVAG